MDFRILDSEHLNFVFRFFESDFENRFSNFVFGTNIRKSIFEFIKFSNFVFRFRVLFLENRILKIGYRFWFFDFRILVNHHSHRRFWIFKSVFEFGNRRFRISFLKNQFSNSGFTKFQFRISFCSSRISTIDFRFRSILYFGFGF